MTALVAPGRGRGDAADKGSPDKGSPDAHRCGGGMLRRRPPPACPDPAPGGPREGPPPSFEGHRGRGRPSPVG